MKDKDIEGNSDVYSYHSFVLPFMCISRNVSIASVLENDLPDNIWKNYDIGIDDNSQRVICIDSIVSEKGYYDAYKFFNECGRNLVFRDTISENVKTFVIDMDKLKKLRYIIGAYDREYSLPILQISIKCYETDIVALAILCKNEKYRSIEDVKRINEYGRRLGLPYWPTDNLMCHKCASYLRIKDDDGKIWSEDNFLNNYNNGKNKEVSLSYVSTVIRGLLNRNGQGYRFRGKAVSGKKEIQLKTLLDEKMYVAALVCDGNYCRQLYNDYSMNGCEFSYETQKDLLELIRVDLPGECSVPNMREIKNTLKNSLYLSSFSEGSEKLMAVSEQSYIKLIPEYDYDVSYFINSYLPLIMIPIVQKYSIIHFQQRIMEITHIAKEHINTGVLGKIMDLQKRYVVFQNQFMPESVTAQKEGSFLYSKMRKELHIPEEKATLECQVGKLFELANINQGYIFSKGALAISVTAIIFTFFTFLVTAIQLSAIDPMNYKGWPAIILTVCSIVLAQIIMCIVLKRRK